MQLTNLTNYFFCFARVERLRAELILKQCLTFAAHVKLW